MGLVETHGTGTALGDPTEVGALERAYGGAAELCLSGAKANSGHGESVAGLLGLLSATQSAEQSACGSNAHLFVLNPLLAPSLRTMYARVPTQSSQLSSKVVSVSSFGYSGTIAHTVVRVGTATQPLLLAGRRVSLALARRSAAIT